MANLMDLIERPNTPPSSSSDSREESEGAGAVNGARVNGSQSSDLNGIDDDNSEGVTDNEDTFEGNYNYLCLLY